MKKIILHKEEEKIVLIHTLMGVEIVAYRCPNSTSVCVLTKLLECKWGFINLSGSNSKPTFVGNNFDSAVRLACACRDVKVFSSQDDLISSVYNKKF